MKLSASRLTMTPLSFCFCPAGMRLTRLESLCALAFPFSCAAAGRLRPSARPNNNSRPIKFLFIKILLSAWLIPVKHIGEYSPLRLHYEQDLYQRLERPQFAGDVIDSQRVTQFFDRSHREFRGA